MFEIPIIFVPVVLIAILVLVLLSDDLFTSFRAGIIAFLVSYALLLVTNGLSHGYQVASIAASQVLLAFLVPPLAFLAFRGPSPVTTQGFYLLGTAVIAFGICWSFSFLIDLVLMLYEISYAVALSYIATSQTKISSWVPTPYVMKVRYGAFLSAICILVFTMGDILIHFMRTGAMAGSESAIVTVLSLFTATLVLVGGLLLFVKFPATEVIEDYDTKVRDYNIIVAYLDDTAAFSDPEYSLNKLARGIKMTPRYVSETVNHITGDNISKLINKKRIELACEMLEHSEALITTVMMDAGFYTKSNFNREFKRVTGLPPSQWRKEQKSVCNQQF